MKKYPALITILFVFFIQTTSVAKDPPKWLRTTLGVVGTVLGVDNKASSTSRSSTSSNGNTARMPSNNYTDYSLGTSHPILIDSKHRDFNIKVKRCVASGDVLIIDLIMTNKSANDIIPFNVYGGAGGNQSTTIYDSEGNKYGGHYASNSNVKIKSGIKSTYSSDDIGQRTLVSNIPTTVSLRVEGFSSSAESVKLIQLSVLADVWNLNWNTKRENCVSIRNIPITRN
ncbi:MAG: hypothetical protein J6W24_02680 [Prevotella sp.]|nr:hypothetical protein [Prevotella sp.]